MARTRRQQATDRQDMARINQIIKTYDGDAAGIAHYVEQCEEWEREYGYREGRDFRRAEYHRLGRETENAKSALAIIEEAEANEE